MRMVEACSFERGISLGPKEFELAQNGLTFPQQHVRQKLLFTGSRTGQPPVADTIAKLSTAPFLAMPDGASSYVLLPCLPVLAHHRG